MTWYRDVQPQQEPFDLGEPDEAGRVQLVFFVIATKRPSATFIEELIAILEAADVGTERQTIFGTSLGNLPAQGRFLSITATPGAPPLGTHNDGVGAYRRPSARILVAAPNWPEASALAESAWKALSDCRNREVQARVR